MALMIVVGYDQAIVRASCAHPFGRSRRTTLLVGMLMASWSRLFD